MPLVYVAEPLGFVPSPHGDISFSPSFMASWQEPCSPHRRRTRDTCDCRRASGTLPNIWVQTANPSRRPGVFLQAGFQSLSLLWGSSAEAPFARGTRQSLPRTRPGWLGILASSPVFVSVHTLTGL